jgi:hypothetical protein
MLLDPEVCTHQNFLLTPNVRRIQPDAKGPVLDYVLDLAIKCGDCHLPFKFRGPYVGIVLNQPIVSDNQLVLSAPIEPCFEVRNRAIGGKVSES